MRVAYILAHIRRSGGWRSHALAFIQAMRQYVEPVLFVAREDLQAARKLFPQDTLFSLPVTQEASLSSLRGLGRLARCWWAIRSERTQSVSVRLPAEQAFPSFDLVHSLEAYPTGLVGSWLAEKSGVPHAMTTHGTYGVVWYEKPLDRLAYQQALMKTALFCPVSHGTARLVQAYFAPALKNCLVRPILNGNRFVVSIPADTANTRRFPSVPHLLSVGDLKPRKGQHQSLAVFGRIQQIYPDAQYTLIGAYRPDSPYFHQLQRIVSNLGLRQVVFRGVVSEAELSQAFLDASLFVLTPQQDGLHFEGFGLVYLEAGAYGLPVIGTRSGGVPDAVRDGETGLLADPDDTEGIAQAVLRLLNDPPLARQMGQANRHWAETLTWERTAQQQYAAYQELFQDQAGVTLGSLETQPASPQNCRDATQRQR